MLELHNVTKKFGQIAAVDNLSFHIKKGEIVGLIGENGSGKTTTIKMIAGLYHPTQGKILIAGMDSVTETDKTRVMIGYIPDEPAVYDKLTGDEFLHFVAQSFAVSDTEFTKKVQELKQLFPMEGQTNGYFEDYSRGTRQKFMIMAALSHNPRLLLIDEPIVGLDPASAETAIDQFRQYAKDNDHAILLCTHTLWVAEKICDRFIILKKGRKIAQGTLADLRKSAQASGANLHQIYLKLSGKGQNE